jgi:hypothetical protein
LENFCEKPHCQCAACREKGHWRIERDFLRAISERLWAIDETTEIAWTLGYERTHGTYPESRIYDEIRVLDDPRYIVWHVRMRQGYTDQTGRRHEWMNPKELASFRSRVACLAKNEEQFKVARQAGAWGVTMTGPSVRNLFLPEVDARHFGYFVDAPPADPPLYDHVLFQLGWLRHREMVQNPDWTPEGFRESVRERFFADAGSAAEEYVEDLLLLEHLIVHDRICLFRSSQNVWDDLDGDETMRMKSLEPKQLERVRAISRRKAKGPILTSMKTTAQSIAALGV